MSPPSLAPGLLDNLEEAIDLLKDYTPEQNLPENRIEPLPSLLAQCEALCACLPETEPVRTIHHFACTGGSLISKCISTMPNVTLLSEVDPLSDMTLEQWGRNFFWPTDLIYRARAALRPVDSPIIEQAFSASLQSLHGALCERGNYLVLRDHAHSQFCTQIDAASRPTLRELVQRALPVCSVVTVRHPLDSFLSLDANNWKYFSPFTLEEYARRYRAFLDRYAGLQVFRYEDLTEDTDGILRQICIALELPFAPHAGELIDIVPMSGDSGRRSSRIGRRARRGLPDTLHAQLNCSSAYAELCAFLGYDPDPT